MKKTKLLAVTLLAGFVLHQTASCQTNATADAAAGVTVSRRDRHRRPAAMTESGAPAAGMTASNETAGASESNAPAASVATNNETAGAGSPLSPTPGAPPTWRRPSCRFNFRMSRSPRPLKPWRGWRASIICSTPKSVTASRIKTDNPNPNPPCPCAGKMSPPGRRSWRCWTTTACNWSKTRRWGLTRSRPRNPTRCRR